MQLQPRRKQGFSLIEVLLVLAILGIISAIAIPNFLGQRRRARMIGDARANAQVLMMGLAQRNADFGNFGPPATYTWRADGTRPTTDILPTFIPEGQSQMNFSLVIHAGGTTYDITVTDTTVQNARVLTANQTLAVVLDNDYNQ